MKNIRLLLAWCLYDWACSAFSIIITTFIFATYFTTHIAANPIIGTYQWANAITLAGVIVAISGPILGAIADHGGRHKLWLMAFTLLSVISAALLWFAYPSINAVNYTRLCIVLGTIGLEIAFVFYNGFLPHIVHKAFIGRLSGWAWGLGYVGGIVALSIVLFGFVKHPPSWLNTETAENVRICGPFTALWFGLFALPLFLFLPDTPAKKIGMLNAVRKGLGELATTLKKLPHHRSILFFLIAHMIFVDGLNTLFTFGGIYAANTFGMDLAHVILFGITMNISAGIGAITLAWVDDYLGSKKTIIFSLICLTIFGMPILFLQTKLWFWCAALILCLFVGPVQAASRSLMARLVPAKQSTEMFGLYAFSGRITAFIGPWLFGMATLHFHTQRAGMASILLFFIIGGILMRYVKVSSTTENACK